MPTMPASPSSTLFGSDFLQKLEYLSLVSRRVFRGSLLAQRRTMQLGGGIEFADHRGYTPGDDFRYVDWNLYARHDELLLKRFQEEEDLHVYLFVDCSQSMALGTPTKFDLARRVAAALAYIALADLDRVSLIAYADRILAEHPLTRGKSRILPVLRFLDGLATAGADTTLGPVAGTFVHRSQRRGLAVVISDLYDPHGFDRGLDILRHHKYEPHLVQIFEPSEADPAVKGDIELVDVESGDARKVTVTERNLRQYREIYQRFQESVHAYCTRYGLGFTRTPNDVPFDELVLKMMRTAGAVR